MSPVAKNRPGAVVAEAVYTLPELKARLNWTDSAFREAKRQGLPVHRVGKRGYVSGSELIAFVTGARGGEGGVK